MSSQNTDPSLSVRFSISCQVGAAQGQQFATYLSPSQHPVPTRCVIAPVTETPLGSPEESRHCSLEFWEILFLELFNTFRQLAHVVIGYCHGTFWPILLCIRAFGNAEHETDLVLDIQHGVLPALFFVPGDGTNREACNQKGSERDFARVPGHQRGAVP